MSSVLKTEKLIVKTPAGISLKCPNMEFQSGELIAIVGGLSSGKSLLLSSIAGLFPVQQGSLKILGKDLSLCSYQEIQRMRARTGFVFEIGGLLSNLSIYDNIGLPMRYHFKRLKKEAVNRQVQKVMGMFSITDYAKLRPTDVSLEVRKRSLFCRACVMRPSLLFMDEPFVGLGLHGRKMIRSFIEKIMKKQNTTIITSVSDIDIIYPLASKFVIMENKEIKHLLNSKQELDKLCLEDPVISNLFHEV
jgi:phospholipid/cholesterol/gamma-HCH transport system ATP-binding protein